MVSFHLHVMFPCGATYWRYILAVHIGATCCHILVPHAVLAPHTGAAYWCHLLLPPTGAPYWCRILVPHTGTTYWCRILVPPTDATYWCHLLVRRASSPHGRRKNIGVGKRLPDARLIVTNRNTLLLPDIGATYWYSTSTYCVHTARQRGAHLRAEVKGGVHHGEGIFCGLEAYRPELREGRAVERGGESTSDSHLGSLPFFQHPHTRNDGPG